MGKAGHAGIPYKKAPFYLAQKAHTGITHKQGGPLSYKRPPSSSGPQRRGLAPTLAESPHEAQASALPPPTAPYIPPLPQSPPGARSPRHYARTTPAEPIRGPATPPTRASNATGSNANATRATAARDDENVTSAERPDTEDGQTARASRPTETTEASLDAPVGSDASVGSYVSVSADAPFPLQDHHSTKTI